MDATIGAVPELPEVETIRCQLEPLLVGRVVTGGWAFDSPKFTDAPEARGHRIDTLRRRGKYLLADLRPVGPGRDAVGGGREAVGGGPALATGGRDTSVRELVVHLGMTGRLAVVGTDHVETGHPHLRARWDLDDGCTLTFHDARRFGRIAVVPAGDHRSLPTLADLGPEPLADDFTPDVLHRGMQRGRRHLKTVLLGQRVVAGVGNIYADEALWLAGVSPLARRLGTARAVALHGAIVEVLRQGLADGGTTLRDYRDASGGEGSHQDRLACYGRAGRPCLRCGTVMVHRVVDGRGTTWCRCCQH